MLSSKKSLAIASILIASIALPLDAQIGMQLGDAPPTTVLTTSQRAFAEAYLAAVTG